MTLTTSFAVRDASASTPETNASLSPALLAPTFMMFTNYIQHVHCEPGSIHHSRDFTSPLENTSRFLNPFSPNADAGIPAIVWSSILLMGATFGGRLGRRFFF